MLWTDFKLIEIYFHKLIHVRKWIEWCFFKLLNVFFRAAKGTQEPFLTLHYDEWICILKGKILFEQGDGEENITAIGGQTVFIKEGTRFRSVFLPLSLKRRGFWCLDSKRDFSLIEEQLSTKVLSSMRVRFQALIFGGFWVRASLPASFQPLPVYPWRRWQRRGEQDFRQPKGSPWN